MSISNDLRQGVNLQKLHTFRTVQQGAFLFTLYQKEILPKLADWICQQKLAYLFLGMGANLVFRRDFQGLIIKNEIGGLRVKQEDAQGLSLVVGSGMLLEDLINYCLEQGWYGLENLSGIPSTVGAAALQNVGAYGCEMQDLVKQVYVFDFPNQCYTSYSHNQLAWQYRSSLLHRERQGELFVYAVELYLFKKYTPILAHQSLKALLLEKSDLKAQSMRAYILNLRGQKLPSIAEIGNSGSFFKNPIIPKEQVDRLRELYPDLPIYAVANSQSLKVSAAYLIESCGWKGRNLARVGVYAKHSLVLVNLGEARGQDIMDIIGRIQQSVSEKFNITLEPEVQIK